MEEIAMNDATGAEEAKILPARTVIVGGKGRMGKMLLDRAEKVGLNAAGLDLPLRAGDIGQAMKDASLVIVSVPARHFKSVLKKITPFMPPGAILSDITSVKETPMRQMHECWDGPIVGTHPLFGPGNRPGDDLPVALTRGKGAPHKAVKTVRGFFEAWGCRVFETDAVTHDQAMARIQNMNFITNLAYFAVLAGQEELLPFLTPSFERRKQAAGKMLNEDAEMFAGLFEANGHSHEAVRQYRKMLNVAASGDIDLLCQRARWWWQKRES